MDPTSIRGLATAYHHCFAGLPRSDSGDHPLKDAHSITVEDSPHRSRTSRCRFGAELELGCSDRCSPSDVGLEPKRSGGDFHVPRDIPDKAAKLASDGDTAFVLRHLSAGVQFTEAVSQTQLCLPGDVTDEFGLAGLADFDGTTHARIEAIDP